MQKSRPLKGTSYPIATQHRWTMVVHAYCPTCEKKTAKAELHQIQGEIDVATTTCMSCGNMAQPQRRPAPGAGIGTQARFEEITQPMTDLNPDQRRILEYIHDRDVQHKPPSAATISPAVAISRTQTDRTLNELERHALIYRDRRWRSQFHITQAGGVLINRRL